MCPRIRILARRTVVRLTSAADLARYDRPIYLARLPFIFPRPRIRLTDSRRYYLASRGLYRYLARLSLIVSFGSVAAASDHPPWFVSKGGLIRR